MSKKDYILIAGVIEESTKRAELMSGQKFCEATATLAVFAECLADELKRDNQAFNRARFLTACGLDLITE